MQQSRLRERVPVANALFHLVGRVYNLGAPGVEAASRIASVLYGDIVAALHPIRLSDPKFVAEVQQWAAHRAALHAAASVVSDVSEFRLTSYHLFVFAQRLLGDWGRRKTQNAFMRSKSGSRVKKLGVNRPENDPVFRQLVVVGPRVSHSAALQPGPPSADTLSLAPSVSALPPVPVPVSDPAYDGSHGHGYPMGQQPAVTWPAFCPLPGAAPSMVSPTVAHSMVAMTPAPAPAPVPAPVVTKSPFNAADRGPVGEEHTGYSQPFSRGRGHTSGRPGVQARGRGRGRGLSASFGRPYRGGLSGRGYPDDEADDSFYGSHRRRGGGDSGGGYSAGGDRGGRTGGGARPSTGTIIRALRTTLRERYSASELTDACLACVFLRRGGRPPHRHEASSCQYLDDAVRVLEERRRL